MLNCFATSTTQSYIPIVIVHPQEFPTWLAQQDARTQNWLQATQFRGDAGNVSLLSDPVGKIEKVLLTGDRQNKWCLGHLPYLLPEGVYGLEDNHASYAHLAMAWGLGAYQFTLYKDATRKPAQLFLSSQQQSDELTILIESIYLVRDLINLPADDLGPSEFAEITAELARTCQASFTQIVGDELLTQQFHSIHIVGRASDDAPRLLDLRWGDTTHPKVVLVGKGVCFDTGGLDIKNAAGMLLMKKDMGGAAHVLGLARMIMHSKLPIQLRVLIPVVENAISGNAFRPGDVFKSRKGITVEIGNTDAEGRLILADTLTEAVSDQPALLIDMATLTGAARIALGTELPGFFSNNDALAADIVQHAVQTSDPLWRMPLFAAYRDSLNSAIADINNVGSEPYAGAITAALFLKEFVPDTIPWLHFDMMAWNLKSRPGRPQGGEAMGLRALFSYLKSKYVGLSS